jgi:hypothetical protein
MRGNHPVDVPRLATSKVRSSALTDPGRDRRSA